MNINKVLLMGRLTADPELKKTGEGISVVRFTLAVNRPKQKDKEQTADFISCVAFRQTAEFLCKYFRKGSALIAFGSIRTGSYDKDGQKVYTTDVIIGELQFGENKQSDTNSKTALTTPTTPQNTTYELGEITDEQLPF